MSLLFSIQFPFVDLRGFTKNTGRLDYPVWPFPNPDTEFIRYFGSIRRRKRGGTEGWIGENEICEAEKALRFTGKLLYTSKDSGSTILLRCAYRRLYFDGKAVGKYEVGICPKQGDPWNLSKQEFKNFVDYCLNLPVIVRRPNGRLNNCALINAGKALCNLYLTATTSQTFSNKSENWWVIPGTPIIFMEENKNQSITLPYKGRSIPIPEDYRFNLFHCLIPFSGVFFRMWMLINLQKTYGSSHNRQPKYNRSRALRISLLRLHAEHECLRLTLRILLNNKGINIEPRSEQSQKLQNYLNTATARIAKLETGANKNYETDIIKLARESLNIINPGQRDRLLQALEDLDIRKNVFKKVVRYTDQWTCLDPQEVKIYMINEGDTYNIGQAGAVGKHARSDNNSFTQIEENKTLAEAAAEIKKLLQQLELNKPDTSEAEKIANIDDEVPPSFKRRLANAMRAGGESAIEEFLDNPYINVTKATIKGWLELP